MAGQHASPLLFIQLGLAFRPRFETPMRPQVLLRTLTNGVLNPLIDAQAIGLLTFARKIGQGRMNHQAVTLPIRQTLLSEGNDSRTT
jgi:hypothetical protein